MPQDASSYLIEVGIRSRDFGPFRARLGDQFVLSLSEAWKGFSSSQQRAATENTYWFQTKSFLTFLTNDSRLDKLRAFLRGEISLSSAYEYIHWQTALSLYRSKLEVEHNEILVTANGKVTGVRAFLCGYCADEAIVPHNLTLRGFKYSLTIGRETTLLPQSTLAALGMSESSFSELVESLNNEEIELDADVVELLRGAVLDTGNGGAIDRIELAVSILNGRLEALEREAARVYFKYIEDTEEAEKWSTQANFIRRAESLSKLFLDKNVDGYSKGKSYQKILDGCALEVLVVFVKKYLGGRLPLNADPVYQQFFTRADTYNINRDQLAWFLGLSTKGMIAGYTLILLETTGNAESIWNLDTHALVVEDGAKDRYRLDWKKFRSQTSEAMSRTWTVRTEPLTATSLTVKDIFEHQLKCREVYLSDVRKSDKERLFLAHYKNHNKVNAAGLRSYCPTHPSMNLARSEFRTLCQNASLDTRSVTIKSLRGSKLLLVGLISRDACAVALEGQHKGTVMAKRYTYHMPEVLRRERAIREFLEWFETIVTIDIEGFAEKIGIDELAYGTRSETAKKVREADVQQALEQQFGGIHCVNPMAGVQPGTKKGEFCSRVENCPTCVNRRGIFVLSLSNLVNVLHWHEALHRAKAQSEIDFSEWVIW